MLQKVFIFLLPIIATVYCNGELAVLNSPKGVQFEGNSLLQQSLLKELYSVALGLTSEQSSSWNGISKVNPFELPKAVVTFVVEGTDSLNLNAKNVFPLESDEEIQATWAALDMRFKERYPFDELTLVNMDLPNGDVNSERVFGVVSPKPIRAGLSDDEESKQFLKEAGVISGLVDKVGELTPDERPAVYFFRTTSLTALMRKSKDNAEKARELLAEQISALSEAFNKAYKGKALFTVVTTNDVVSRRTRQATQDEKKSDPDYNLAKNYNANYPVVFNIILWFGVAFFFSLLAVSISISTMDPGRDSIIYRMTSTRIKKEN